MFTEFTVRNMSVRELLKNTSEDTPIPIVLNNDTDIGMPQLMLHCNLRSKKITSLILLLLPSFIMTVKQNAVAHVPLHLSIFYCFLNLLDCSTSVMDIGKWVNRAWDSLSGLGFLHWAWDSCWIQVFFSDNPAVIYLLKVDNRNTRTRCEICSKLTIKTPE